MIGPELWLEFKNSFHIIKIILIEQKDELNIFAKGCHFIPNKAHCKILNGIGKQYMHPEGFRISAK